MNRLSCVRVDMSPPPPGGARWLVSTSSKLSFRPARHIFVCRTFVSVWNVCVLHRKPHVPTSSCTNSCNNNEKKNKKKEVDGEVFLLRRRRRRGSRWGGGGHRKRRTTNTCVYKSQYFIKTAVSAGMQHHCVLQITQLTQ